MREQPFNSPVDVGLRLLTVLSTCYPAAYSMDRLVAFDYFVVHTDDLPGGAPSLHPPTPYRSGEIVVRRELIQRGLRLLESRGLTNVVYKTDGIAFRASDRAGAFLDALGAPYTRSLRDAASWVVQTYGESSIDSLQAQIAGGLDEWGAEFEMDAVLWSEGEA